MDELLGVHRYVNLMFVHVGRREDRLGKVLIGYRGGVNRPMGGRIEGESLRVEPGRPAPCNGDDACRLRGDGAGCVGALPGSVIDMSSTCDLLFNVISSTSSITVGSIAPPTL